MVARIALTLAPTLDPADSAAWLPRVERVVRSGNVLHPGPLNLEDVPSLNVARGCAHRCTFCSVRASAGYIGDEVLQLYEGTAAQLAKELAARRKLPRAVYISPSTDPFPPFSEVQQETARIVEVLAEFGVQAWLSTRGFIRPTPLKTLAKHAKFVRLTVGLTTLDRDLQRALEPLAAPPNLRLRQLASLSTLGIPAGVSLEPLLPGLTDTRQNLVRLLDAAAAVGLEQVSVGYAFLRTGIRENLTKALARAGFPTSIFDDYDRGPVLVSDGIAGARYLPKSQRQHGYARIMALAAERGLRVRINATVNPDFQTTSPTSVPGEPRQRLLPIFLAASLEAQCGNRRSG